MSVQPVTEPVCEPCQSTPEIETTIEGRGRDIGGFAVRRILPSVLRRAVGPFVFFDHMGPAEFAPGEGIDVLPHPHIGLATVTYLFGGELVHRDSLGSHQEIRPGAINWMTAGRGIVHSERTAQRVRSAGGELHGIQLWVGLPQAHEETAPAFFHHPAESLPELERGGARLRVLSGAAYGVAAAVTTFSPLFYVEAIMPAGSVVELPGEYPERAAYVAEGVVRCGAERSEALRMLVFAENAAPRLRAETDARVMLLGGAPLDGPRHMFWNFVSSSHERIEEAKRRWAEGGFAKVPGDEEQYVPLPG